MKDDTYIHKTRRERERERDRQKERGADRMPWWWWTTKTFMSHFFLTHTHNKTQRRWCDEMIWHLTIWPHDVTRLARVFSFSLKNLNLNQKHKYRRNANFFISSSHLHHSHQCTSWMDKWDHERSERWLAVCVTRKLRSTPKSQIFERSERYVLSEHVQ